MTSKTFCIVLALALAGCAAGVEEGALRAREVTAAGYHALPDVPEGANPLSGDEIRSVIADRWLAREDSFSPGASHRNEEFFCASGVWRGVGARVPLGGRYTTSNSELCVQQGDSQFCRRLLRDDAGRYFTQRIGANLEAQPLVQVRIYAPEHDTDCPL